MLCPKTGTQNVDGSREKLASKSRTQTSMFLSTLLYFFFFSCSLWEGGSISGVGLNFRCASTLRSAAWLKSSTAQIPEWGWRVARGGENGRMHSHKHTCVKKEKKQKKKTTYCHTKTPTQLPQNSMSTNNEFQKEILPRSLQPETSPEGEDVLIIRCCVCGLTTMLPRKRSRHSSFGCQSLERLASHHIVE